MLKQNNGQYECQGLLRLLYPRSIILLHDYQFGSTNLSGPNLGPQHCTEDINTEGTTYTEHL